MDNAHFYLILSALLFSIGAAGVAIRRNPLVMFMCIELMLNSANLAFASFARFGAHAHQRAADGPMFIFLVMTIAAAEAVVGLAIIIAIFRSRSAVDADELASMKG